MAGGREAPPPQAKAALPGAVPDEVLVGLFVEAMRAVDPVSYSGVVLDGFPWLARKGGKGE